MPTCIWAFWGDKGELNDLGLVFFLKEIDTYVMEWNCTNMICMFFSVNCRIILASTCQPKVDYNVSMGGGVKWTTL